MRAVTRKRELIRYHFIEWYFFSVNLIVRPRFAIPVLTAFFLFMPHEFKRDEMPLFRVVIDPGHGGVGMGPMSVHGDRYDLVGKRYLDVFKEGASRGTLHERVIVYAIATKAKAILDHLSPGRDPESFYRILERYSADELRRINIVTLLSRGPSITEEQAETQEDPNAPYRIFDYPSQHGSMARGRLSRINRMRPHLVVSLHLASDGPREYEGPSPVIVPPYHFLEQGLRYLQKRIHRKSFFFNSPFRDWFVEETTRSEFEWFLNDVSLYFTGYPLTRGLRVVRSGFKGYRHNMIQWPYADSPGWEHAAKYHLPNSRYAVNPREYVPEGRFWERERSVYERYRRDGGPEGFGGDNLYASREIARFIAYSLNRRGGRRVSAPGKSYVSVWIVPLYVNAVTAFLELGYLNRARDREILTKRQDEIAEGIAVGVYSLCAGIVPKKSEGAGPKGRAIDFAKYILPNGGSYFEEAGGE